MFTTLESEKLKENKVILESAFKYLNKLLCINYFEKKGDNEKYYIEFTYRNSFNSWSHSVKLIAYEDGVYFQTYRIDEKEDLIQYKFIDYAHKQIGCKIPISETVLIMKVLTEYDNFKIK